MHSRFDSRVISTMTDTSHIAVRHDQTGYITPNTKMKQQKMSNLSFLKSKNTPNASTQSDSISSTNVNNPMLTESLVSEY